MSDVWRHKAPLATTNFRCRFSLHLGFLSFPSSHQLNLKVRNEFQVLHLFIRSKFNAIEFLSTHLVPVPTNRLYMSIKVQPQFSSCGTIECIKPSYLPRIFAIVAYDKIHQPTWSRGQTKPALQKYHDNGICTLIIWNSSEGRVALVVLEVDLIHTFCVIYQSR